MYSVLVYDIQLNCIQIRQTWSIRRRWHRADATVDADCSQHPLAVNLVWRIRGSTYVALLQPNIY